MNIPADAIIAIEKLTRYLLIGKSRNDKSKYLERAGFTQENPEALLKAIRSLTNAVGAEEDRTSEYGIFYRVSGKLMGPNGVSISVVTVWLQRKTDGRFHFITLVPAEEHSNET